MAQYPLTGPDAWPRYIGAFQVGDILEHGGVVIEPNAFRHLRDAYGLKFAFFDNKRVAYHLGFPAALVDPLMVFQYVFGLSVHMVSSQGRFNKLYANMQHTGHVCVNDTVDARSEVVGVEFLENPKKPGEMVSTGSVQVRTGATGRHLDPVLSYVRQVICAGDDRTFAPSNTTVPQPTTADLWKVAFPPTLTGLTPELMGCSGPVFEDLTRGMEIFASRRESLSLAKATMLQIHTRNDAATHHHPPCIVYGGCVKLWAEGAISEYLPWAWPVAMNSGDHTAPTYASDIIRAMHVGSATGREEELRARAKILHIEKIPSRSDIGLVTIQITVYKLVTPAGRKALDLYAPNQLKNISSGADGDLLQVFTCEQVWALPTREAMRTAPMHHPV